MKTNHEIARIMTAAHAMTRATCRQYPAADYRATLAAALKIAWREDGKSAAEIFRETPGEEIAARLYRAAWHEYGRRDARYTADGRPLPNVFTWVQDANPADDLRAVANEAYIRVSDMVDDPRHAEKSLARIISRAIFTAAQAIGRQERRNGSALKTRRPDPDADAAAVDAYIIEHAAPTADPIAPGPEAAVIALDAIERAAHDDTDRAIIRRQACGYTQTETAEALDISRKTVNARLAAIRDRYRRGE